jgi:hypothetical protein
VGGEGRGRLQRGFLPHFKANAGEKEEEVGMEILCSFSTKERRQNAAGADLQ